LSRTRRPQRARVPRRRGPPEGWHHWMPVCAHEPRGRGDAGSKCRLQPQQEPGSL